MNTSFYQYLKTLEAPIKDEKQQFIHHMIADLAFPKQSQDYQEIAIYLEDNALYVTNMDLFDELWQSYLEATSF